MQATINTRLSSRFLNGTYTVISFQNYFSLQMRVNNEFKHNHDLYENLQ